MYQKYVIYRYGKDAAALFNFWYGRGSTKNTAHLYCCKGNLKQEVKFEQKVEQKSWLIYAKSQK